MFKASLLVALFPVVLIAAEPSKNADASAPHLADWLASRLSRTVRELDGERLLVEKQLESLPQPARVPSGARLGWHSAALKSPANPVWVQVDLESRADFDLIALIPARGDAGSAGGMGYGFPVRFQVDVSDDPGFRQRTLICPPTLTAFPNPGSAPVLIPAIGISGRYVRVTIIEPWARRDDWISALGEIMVFKNRLNLAAGKSARASSNLIALPAWDLSNLTDGQSALGPPVTSEASPSNGHLSK